MPIQKKKVSKICRVKYVQKDSQLVKNQLQRYSIKTIDI